MTPALVLRIFDALAKLPQTAERDEVAYLVIEAATGVRHPRAVADEGGSGRGLDAGEHPSLRARVRPRSLGVPQTRLVVRPAKHRR